MYVWMAGCTEYGCMYHLLGTYVQQVCIVEMAVKLNSSTTSSKASKVVT